MSVKSKVKQTADPRNAPAYFTRSGSRNWEPALVWLVIAAVVITTIRTGQLPSGTQAVTWILLAGVVVGAGAVLPEPVGVILAGLLIAGAFNVSAKLTAVFTNVNAAVARLGGGS